LTKVPEDQQDEGEKSWTSMLSQITNPSEKVFYQFVLQKHTQFFKGIREMEGLRSDWLTQDKEMVNLYLFF